MCDNDEVKILRYPGKEHIIPLLSCPCCDADVEFCQVDGSLGWWAECSNCNVRCGDMFNVFASRLDLCEEWNNRTFRMDFIPEILETIIDRMINMFRHQDIPKIFDDEYIERQVKRVLLPHIKLEEKKDGL